MRSFQHLEPALRVHFGAASLDNLQKELDRAGCKRVMIFCGSTMARAGSALEMVVKALGNKYSGTFAGVRAHSPVDSVLEGARHLRGAAVDAVVAVGGGSAIVTARAASIVLAEGEDVRALATQRLADGRFSSPKLPAPKLVNFVVPTTPTTAIAKAGSAIFDTTSQERLALFDPKTRAQAIFIHPSLTATAPASLLLSASLNGLAMACEGLESGSAEPLADALLMHALRLYRDHLPALLSPGQTSGPPAQLVLASVMAGRGTDHASGGLASVLGHAIGVRCHIENGIANAIVLPHTMLFNGTAAASGAARIGEVFCGHACSTEEAVAHISGFMRDLGIPARLRDSGVLASDLDLIATAAMDDWFLSRSPRSVDSVGEVLAVLNAAW